jgi:hypothetical protein
MLSADNDAKILTSTRKTWPLQGYQSRDDTGDAGDVARTDKGGEIGRRSDIWSLGDPL